jgi:RNA polymerase primary sigma factor
MIRSISAKRVKFIREGGALASYYDKIKTSKSLTLAEEGILSLRIQSGDKNALNLLIESNLKFVVTVCRRYENQGMPMGDLISEGNLGLIRAAQRFDGSKNFRFISYAVWWIRQGILTALAEQSRGMSIAPARIGLLARIRKVSRRLEQRLGHTVALAEVADEMKLGEKAISECVNSGKYPLSMNQPAAGQEHGSLQDSLPDTEGAPADEAALKTIVERKLGAVLGSLGEREERVLRLHYGIGAHASMSLSEIGNRLEVSRERIRQIKNKALQKLRHPTKAKQMASLRG